MTDLDMVKAGMCPFCAAGPFVIVAAHVSRTHGVTVEDFRDLLGIKKRESICDPAYSEGASLRGRERFPGGFKISNVETAGIPRHRSSALAASQEARRKCRVCPICGGEYQTAPGSFPLRTCSESCASVARVRGGKRAWEINQARGWVSPTAVLTDEQRAEIVQAYREGGMSQSALGAKYGVKQSTIGNVLRRAGIPKMSRAEAGKRSKVGRHA